MFQETFTDNQQVQVLTGDNRLETRRVKTGITDNVDIQILDGLTAGEKVVLSRQDETQTGERDIL